MPQLRAEVRSKDREEADPGELRITVEFTNDGAEPVPLNLHQAAHPALVLEVEDPNGKAVRLPPPSAPDTEDLEAGQLIGPGESVTLDYAGFLDRSLAPGTYRVRYAGRYPALGGTPDDPLLSDWTTFAVRRMPIDVPGIPVPTPKPSPEEILLRPKKPWPLLLEPIRILIAWLWWRVWRRLWCLIVRVLLRRQCRVLSQEFDQARTETISNAPAGSEAWNGTYAWRARFLLTVDEPACRVTAAIRVRLAGTITAAQRSAWESAIEATWNNRFKLCHDGCCCESGLDIVTDIAFVSSGEHQVVNVGATTTNMGNWGASDTVDVSHEFGHMLGALDEYFTVNGVDWGAGRQAGAPIMNNPANPPVARHYDVVRDAASSLVGHTCRTIERTAGC
jgi:hypothetical protein